MGLMHTNVSRVIGLVPLAGTGSRLGMPFHKALAPTIVSDRIVPLYRHSVDRLRRVASQVYGVIAPEQAKDPCLRDLDVTPFIKPERGELPSSIRWVAKGENPNATIAVALPDSIWFPEDGMERLMARFNAEEPLDGVLGLFLGDNRVLDAVETKDGYVTAIEPHDEPDAEPDAVLGWGCLVATAGCLRGLRDDRPLGPQLAEYRFATVNLIGPYYDLGTPARYIAFHDLQD